MTNFQPCYSALTIPTVLYVKLSPGLKRTRFLGSPHVCMVVKGHILWSEGRGKVSPCSDTCPLHLSPVLSSSPQKIQTKFQVPVPSLSRPPETSEAPAIEGFWDMFTGFVCLCCETPIMNSHLIFVFTYLSIKEKRETESVGAAGESLGYSP